MLYIILSYLLYPVFYVSALLRGRGPVRRILVIQPAKIGDMVCSTPVFRALKSRFPGARLAVLADPASCPILEANPMVDEIIPLKAGAMRGLGGKLGLSGNLMAERFDLSVALLPGIATTIIPLWAFIPRRLSVGPDSPGITFRLAAPLNNRVKWHDIRRNVLETYAGLLYEGLGIPVTPESTRMELPVTPGALEEATRLLNEAGVKEGGVLVGMAPAARNRMKEVPPALYAEVADILIERFSARVVLIGGPGDSGATSAVREAMRHGEGVIDTAGRFRLSALPALLLKLDLFMSVDSGPVYMAIALGVPTINLAGPCAMEERPLGTRNVVVQRDLACSPCSYTFRTATTCRTGTRECVTTLTPEPILEAAKRLLKEGRNRQKTGPMTGEMAEEAKGASAPRGRGARGG